MAKVRLREACKNPDRPSYSTCVRLNKDGKLPLYQVAGNGPLYVDTDDLDGLMQPIGREVAASRGARPTRAVPERPRGSAA